MSQDLINGLVFRDDDGRPTTTSLIVAERFCKEHKNVLRDIERLQEKRKIAGLPALKFEPGSYQDLQRQDRPMMLMDREAFTHLAWSFTGVEAAIWQDRFYKAFDALEKALTNGLTVWTKLDQVLSKHIEMSGKALTAASLVADRMPVVEARVEKISNRVERIEDAVDRLRPTLLRKQFADATKELYRLVGVKFYRGLCPCCQQIEIISGTGAVLPIARYDHWTERNRNWPTDGWIVCHHCNQMLEKERHKHTAQFSLFQKRLEMLQGPADQLPIRGL